MIFSSIANFDKISSTSKPRILIYSVFRGNKEECWLEAGDVVYRTRTTAVRIFGATRNIQSAFVPEYVTITWDTTGRRGVVFRVKNRYQTWIK